MYTIVGANGFLGAYLRKAILDYTDEEILALGRDIDEEQSNARLTWMKCDITNKRNVDSVNEILKQHQDNKIIFLAAYHHPDLVEKNPKLAWNVNIIALAEFLNKIENVKCFFYPSTDSVYGEGNTHYHFKEEDQLHPVNRYGHHKVAAESIVNAYGYNVVRFPFLIAPSLLQHKTHFYDQIVETIRNGKKMEMFADSMRSSLDFGTAAYYVIQLMENYSEDMPKILNVSGDDDLSKYDIGLMIAKQEGISSNLIVPISADATEGIFEAKRAKSTLLDNTKLKQYLGVDSIRINL